jgi:hypothetical protein
MAAFLGFLLFLARPIGAAVTLVTAGAKAVGNGTKAVATHKLTKVAVVAVVLLAVNGGFFVAGQVSQRNFDQAQYKQEAANAVAKADAARDAADKKFVAGKFTARPSNLPKFLQPRPTDGFARD